MSKFDFKKLFFMMISAILGMECINFITLLTRYNNDTFRFVWSWTYAMIFYYFFKTDLCDKKPKRKKKEPETDWPTI